LLLNDFHEFNEVAVVLGEHNLNLLQTSITTAAINGTDNKYNPTLRYPIQR